MASVDRRPAVRGIWRLSVVGALGVVAFGAALVNFHEPPATECQMDAVRDVAYRVELLTTFSVEPTTQTLRVTRDGVPVTGAEVCLRADRGGMGVSDVATEAEPGVYDVPVRFEAGGRWDGTVIVAGGTAKPVRIAVPIDVQEDAPPKG